MWPELCARKFVTSPLTQTWPTCFSSSRLICVVSSETDNTLRVCSGGNNSPKSHCDLDCLPISFEPIKPQHAAPKQAQAGIDQEETANSKQQPGIGTYSVQPSRYS